MISVHNNMLAMGANTQFLINNKKNQKTTEKLSSGYRINRAADDAAGLAISEKMRRQIRGLRQGTENAQDGISFVQIADGAMNEAHDILQRMNELAIKSLNGTLTESDREACEAEFNQLRSEIDSIDRGTYYNELPVFEEHEASFYQIAGNRKWDPGQMHTVSSLSNELTIHLSGDYVPSEYTVKVPAGTYTTQELMDEIDDALERMSPPNPGFEVEFTKEGYCNLNFERADGGPAEIAMADGSLSYLLYDYFNGGSSTSLLGTTVFDMESPLIITAGQNDELGFYVEAKNAANYIFMKIPAGAYTRSQMIDLINKNLAANPDASGVKAIEYGGSSIQIKGADSSINITGLKGNMFKLETARPYYTSVFYDNVKYGYSGGGTSTAAAISGNARYGSVDYQSFHTTKIVINDTNNILRLKLNELAGFEDIKLNNGEYTITELAKEINDQLSNNGLEDEAAASWRRSTSYGDDYYYLTLTSKKSGAKSLIELDQSVDAASVYAKTYDALFRATRYLPSETSGRNACLIGAASLNGKIELDSNAKLLFNINGKQYAIDNIGGTHDNAAALAAKINDYIKNSPGFLGMQDKIEFVIGTGNRLEIRALDKGIQSIEFDANAGQRNDTYDKLFTDTRTYTQVNTLNVRNEAGSISRPQGATTIDKKDAKSIVTIPGDRQSIPIKIDGSNNVMSFKFSMQEGGVTREITKQITLSPNTYGNIASLAAEMNRQFSNSKDSYLESIRVSYNSGNGELAFTSTPPSEAEDGSWKIDISGYSNSGSAWRPILGEVTQTYKYHGSSYGMLQASLTTYDVVPENVTIGADNNKLVLSTMENKDVEIAINNGSYTTREALKKALEEAIDKTDLKGKVTVEITSGGKFKISANSDDLSASGSFYQDILACKKTVDINDYKVTGKDGTSYYEEAYIIGRKDLTEEPIEIYTGANDVLTFDFTYPKGTKQMDVTIPKGVYTGDELAAALQEKIQEKFGEEGLDAFKIKVTIGGFSTNVVGANDDTALQIVVEKKDGETLDAGRYILDGIRGNAASSIFYKTTGRPQETYIAGTKDISESVFFKEGQNVFTFSVDSKQYKYTLPENTQFTGQEFVDLLNDMFENGDDGGSTAPVRASIENGALKLTHNVPGTHTISDIGGSARSAIFLEETGRKSRDPLTILVGAETRDVVEIPRTRIGSCALKINSITVSRSKYAEKAVGRIKGAINLLSAKRSTYGAMQNRLEHTVNNNNNVIENTEASESRIRDADMASEALAQARNSIMMQASQAMLVQANRMSDMVMSLLQ